MSSFYAGLTSVEKAEPGQDRCCVVVLHVKPFIVERWRMLSKNLSQGSAFMKAISRGPQRHNNTTHFSPLTNFVA